MIKCAECSRLVKGTTDDPIIARGAEFYHYTCSRTRDARRRGELEAKREATKVKRAAAARRNFHGDGS